MNEWYREFGMTAATTALDDETLARLAARFALESDVEVAVVFGSAARGELREESDIDLYLVLRPRASWATAWLLGLEEELCHAVGRPVELVVEDVETTSTLLRLQVAREGVPLHERVPGAWVRAKTRALMDYYDMAETIDACAAGVRRRLTANRGDALGR